MSSQYSRQQPRLMRRSITRICRVLIAAFCLLAPAAALMAQAPPDISTLVSSNSQPAVTNTQSAILPNVQAGITNEQPALSAYPQYSLTNEPPSLPPFNVSTVAASPRLAGTSQLAAPPSAVSPTSQPLLQLGPAIFRPHLLYSVSYGNGLQPSPGQQQNTLINQLSPGILVQLGPHWSLDYTPTLIFYSGSLFKDATDHSVTLSGRTTYGDWALGLSQNYSLTSQPLVETAAQTREEVYSTALQAAYQVNSRVSLDLGLNQTFRFAAEQVAGLALNDLREWSTMDWVNYQIVPRLVVGGGVGFSYDDLAVGSDVMSEQYMGRISWKPGEKLVLLLSGGMSDMQFLGSGSPDLLSPVFTVSLQYHIFTTTTLSLSGGQSVSPSFFQHEVSESTSLSAGIHQRLLGKLSLDVTGSYGTTVYHSTASDRVTSGLANYDSTSLSVSLSTAFLKRATASAFYQLSYYSSGAAIYDYTTTQVGLTLGYSF